ncbi:MAG: arginine--tRNA ligase, partial [Thermoplasmata archaeon]
MLIFNDVKKSIVEKIRSLYEINENEVYFDESNHSDIAVRLFSITKKYGKSNSEVYENIMKKIENEEYMDRIESNGPYINIYLSRQWMLKSIVESTDKYGRYPDVFQEAERVGVEHTSANPTGPLHVGRARNSIIGDSIYRLVQRYGYRASAMYFVNDSGKQMMSLYTAYKMYGGDLTVDNLLSDYQRIYREMEGDPEIGKRVEENIERYEKGDARIYDEIRKIASVMLDGITGSLSRIGVSFDEFNW